MRLGGCRDAQGAKYLQECTLYVTVEPCICVRRGDRMGAGERVVWAPTIPRRASGVTRDGVPPQDDRGAGVLREECEELMSGFFAGLRDRFGKRNFFYTLHPTRFGQGRMNWKTYKIE